MLFFGIIFLDFIKQKLGKPVASELIATSSQCFTDTHHEGSRIKFCSKHFVIRRVRKKAVEKRQA